MAKKETIKRFYSKCRIKKYHDLYNVYCTTTSGQLCYFQAASLKGAIELKRKIISMDKQGKFH